MPRTRSALLKAGRRALLIGLAVALPAVTVITHEPASTNATFTASATAFDGMGLISPYQRAVMNDTPTNFYRLDEPGPYAWDAGTGGSGYPGNFITDASGSVASGGAPLYTGSGASVVLNGGTIQMSVPLPVSGSDSRLTVEFWMYIPSTGTGGYDGKMPFSLDGAALQFGAGRFGFSTYNSDLLAIPDTGLFDKPVHVVAVFSNPPSVANYAVGKKLYINGVLQTLTMTGTPAGTGLGDWNRAQINGTILNPNAFRFQNGARISDLAMYNNRELTQAQISAHYAARVG
jgi:hypothetical protein